MVSPDDDSLERWIGPAGRAIRERVRPLNGAAVAGDRPFVLYWMRSAWRGHENPALDAATTVANRLGIAVLVVQEVREGERHASDRNHAFVLEGALDVRRELAARGYAFVLHVERPGHRGSPLAALAARAAVVITEDMPVEPFRSAIEQLATGMSTAVWCVDTACVVPMRLVGRAYDRAFRFRDATRLLRSQRLGRAWTDICPERPPFVPGDLPFEPVDLENVAIPDLVAACDIDHTVAPVPHTRGGSTAGYARWSDFRDRRLDRYARDRNDALNAGAVSRLSPYLHYGQVSPFRIAREAATRGGTGAAKFLDELLIWRELSHAWCFHRRDHDAVSALPEWAAESLTAHAGDRRPAMPSWETLTRGRTGDPLWDAAQRSLAIHGMLHNNVRMTWGKALLNWTVGPDACIERLVELNHRFALDGEDPNSYGGLFWCLGLFDRPFAPERPIFGTVRARSTAQHAHRLDVQAYARQTGRPASARPLHVAVVGAGIAGLICARTLVDHGWTVTVFDKGRRPGGRASTRRSGGGVFDHGAQYFTVRDERLARFVRSWQEDGIVGPWTGRIVNLYNGSAHDPCEAETRFVGMPGMSAVARHLAADLDVRCETRVARLDRSGGQWHLLTDEGGELGRADAVVAAVPAPQAVPLLTRSAALADAAGAVAMAPCWSVMARFAGPLPIGFDGAFVGRGPLRWIARDGAKPGREGAETWVLHANAAWTRAHLDRDGEAVVTDLLAAFASATGLDAITPAFAAAQRWRFARVEAAIGRPCLFEAEGTLGACGDWCLGPRIEAAFLSGAAMAGRLLGRDIPGDAPPQPAFPDA